MDWEIAEHCAAIEECNQRGGRMLSVVDLIEAGTMTRDLAAYALAVIRKGCSFLVGAAPGGAGKTTVMGALLNLVPRGMRLVAADSMAAMEAAFATGASRVCYVCHEISPGGYYAYLWGSELRRYFDLADAGHMLATNLHADTVEQARDQICAQNHVPDRLFRRINLAIFLSVESEGGRPARRISLAAETDGTGPHSTLWEIERGFAGRRSALVDGREFAEAITAIDSLIAFGARTQPEVRSFLVRERFV